MTSPGSAVEAEGRILVFAPIGRDGDLTQQVLVRASIPCLVCLSLAELCRRFTSDGAGALILTEEALGDREVPELVGALEGQPAWSDVSVLLFAGGPAGEATLGTLRTIDSLRNVTLLERPIRLAAVLSAVRAVLRGRARQYEVRDLLVALHRARAEAESANRLKDEFLATLSHELRTPLNAILGWTSMLVRGQIEPGRLPGVFESLNRNAHSQAQLIADVLDVSRIITGKLQLRTTTVDIDEVVARAADVIRPAAVAKNIALVTPDPSGCLVHGDPDRLQQVFWNLLSNAVKFTPPGGSVRVDLAPGPAGLTVTVADTGVGIHPEFVPFVFDRFRQADQTATRVHGGLGLGLSIVKHLTELHGGTVVASSDGPGRGARFDVHLRPHAGATPAPVLPFAAIEDRDVTLDGAAILVVDDDESTREVVAAALQRARATVHLASSAAEAWQSLQEQAPDLIVADLGMPAEDGFTFIRRVRSAGARAIPAIALSAYADARSQESALAAGFTAFLAKPARPASLVQLIGTLLGARDAQAAAPAHVQRLRDIPDSG